MPRILTFQFKDIEIQVSFQSFSRDTLYGKSSIERRGEANEIYSNALLTRDESPSHSYVKAHINLLDLTGKDVLVWSMGTGSAPFYIFQDKFNLPILVGGLGHGSRAHSPNEFAFLESKTGAGGIIDFEISIAKLLSKIGEIGKVK